MSLTNSFERTALVASGYKILTGNENVVHRPLQLICGLETAVNVSPSRLTVLLERTLMFQGMVRTSSSDL